MSQRMNSTLKDILRGLIHSLDDNSRENAWKWICGHGQDIVDFPNEPVPDIIHGIVDKPSEANIGLLIESVWTGLVDNDRKALGSVYTKMDVVVKLLDMIDYTGKEKGILIDPACGAGAFLIKAAERRFWNSRIRNVNERVKDVLQCIVGVDISTQPGKICRTMLRGLIIHWVAQKKQIKKLDFAVLENCHPIILKKNSWKDDIRSEIQNRSPDLEIKWVVGNPPYVERKLWTKYQISRDEMEQRFPSGNKKENALAGKALFGAADLYMAFLLLSEELVEDTDGWVAFVLPNKFQVAKYAQYYRKRLRKEERLRFILDVSTMKDLFPGVMVYPILIGIGPKRRRWDDTVKLGFRMQSLDDDSTDFSANDIFDVVDPPVFFTIPEDLGGIVEHWLGVAKDQEKRLGHYIECKTTCSFHAKGLREQFIDSEEEQPEDTGADPPIHPYLGGKSHTKRNEVRPFSVDPFGYTIKYDQKTLKEEHGNPLPPLENTFLRKKIIYCQHALSMVATPDLKGEWVTKDTYPVAFPLRSQEDDEILMICAIMNSRVFSTLYNLMFRGIAIGADYLHFLPIYLKDVPVPEPSKRQRQKLVMLAKKALEGDETAFVEIDKVVFRVYKMNYYEREAITEYSNKYLGWNDEDPFSRM